jgi:DNA-directed RNA polymerase beta' subunit
VLARFIKNTCGNGSFVKRIPDFAFLAPNEFKSGLIQAYFDGDGNFQQDKGHHQIRACSRSEQLIKDMALLLSYFDIFGNIRSNFVKDYNIYNLTMSARYSVLYQEKIGSLVHKDKLSEMVEYALRNDAHNLSDEIDKINGLGEVIAKCGKTLKLPGQSRTYGRWAKKETIGRRTLQKYIKEFEQHPDCHLIKEEMRILNQASNSNVIWDEIKSIEIYTPEQTEYVYDFTVPANQTFMTDYGVIVHNTLNSVTYETPIIVRNRSGQVQKVEIGEFIEKHISNPKKLDYYKEKDTTYAELLEYFEIPSCTEEGDIVWKEVEAVTRHPVINKDGTNTMLKITTEENREVIATKAKSFLKLVEGKIVPVDGDSLKVGDYLPVSTKKIDFQENKSLDLKEVLPPTEYIYSTEIGKAQSVMNEHHWWKNHNGKTFVLPYSRSDSLVSKLSDKMREGQQSKTVFEKNCVYMKKNGQANYTIPETIPLDYNFGYLVGAYAAEGCMTKHQISIANNETEYFAPILELCEKWNITTKTYKREDCIQDGWTTQDIRIYNSLLCRLLEKFCGKLSHNKFISDHVIFSNRECLLGFLDAYIGGDGTISKKDHTIMVSSVSKNMLIDVQQILNILGIYSHIGKYKKPETNNRGSKNTKQSYNLIVRNKQAPKLASMLNMKIKNKQENLQYIFAHESIYKYEFARKHAMVPNEIDGEICFEERCSDKYRDVLFDKIKYIEEVSNTTNYAYDLTVLDTKNFNIYNGLALRDTFHHTGISSKSNVTRGVPRIEEILSLSSEPKNPSLTIFLKPEDQADREKAQSIMYMLEHTKMQEIVKSTEISFDPDDLNSLISEDHSTMEQYRAFESMMDECNEVSLSDDTNEKSKWILRMEMDPEIMLEKNITMDDVNFTLKNSFGDEISCVYTDYNADKLVFRIRMNSVMKQSANKSGPKKAKVNPLDQSDQIYLLKNFQDQLLNNIVIRGIKKINKVILRKIKDNVIETAGSYKKEDIWVLDTVGSNLIDVLAIDYIDAKRTFSNDIVETYNVFGIEAARQTIMNELAEVIEFDGTYVNYHHMCILCDRMTFTNKMISIFRHGINNDNIGPIAKASFEETPEMFLKAARHAELDMMRGVSANIMCGQEGLYGTNAFQVVLDLEEMRKLSDMIAEETVDLALQIEKSFGDYENVEDKCSTQNLTIENNVNTIKTSDLGTDNDYEPGF